MPLLLPRRRAPPSVAATRHPWRSPAVTDAFDPKTSIDAGGLAGTLQALIRAQVGTRLRRRDRSSTLVREKPGRIDRLDLLVAALLLLAALTLRGWRVEEPYDMYFDEVYHARTATEFLQAWRYGEPPDAHLRIHPSAPRQVPDGARHRGLRRRCREHDRPPRLRPTRCSDRAALGRRRDPLRSGRRPDLRVGRGQRAGIRSGQPGADRGDRPRGWRSSRLPCSSTPPTTGS